MAAVCCTVLFFALPPLSNALGVPTNAVYGFLTMLVKLYNDLHPDYVAVAFDKGKETFRTELYADYKGNRPNAPDDLRPQFGLIREVLEALGITVIEEEGYEGDDIIGSLSKNWEIKIRPCISSPVTATACSSLMNTARFI